MSPKACVAAALLILLGCSGHQQLSREELKSIDREVISIAAEGELLADLVLQGRVTDLYANGHPEYLRKQAKDLSGQLEKGETDAQMQNELLRLRTTANELNHILAALPDHVNDPSWQEVRLRFVAVRRVAEEIKLNF
jgi:hypothetical protein